MDKGTFPGCAVELDSRPCSPESLMNNLTMSRRVRKKVEERTGVSMAAVGSEKTYN